MAQEAFSVFAPALTSLEGLTYAADRGVYATGADAFATFDLTAGGRALGGVAGTASTFPYFSASNVVALATITAQGLALLDDGSAATQRTTLGLGSIATQAASAVAITGGTIFGASGQFTGSSAAASGSGVELLGGGTAIVQGYNRTSSAFIALRLDGLTLDLRVSGTTRATVNANGIDVVGSVKASSYTVAGLPSAATHGAGAMVYVSNESGGAVMAYSDGTNWRRVTDRVIVS